MKHLFGTLILVVAFASPTLAQLSFLRPNSTAPVSPIKRLYTGSTGKLSLMNFSVKSVSSVGISSGDQAVAISPTAAIETFAPASIALSGRVLNYPNPFRKSESTTLYYTLSETGTVDIAIFDMMAHQIAKVTRTAGLPGATVGQNRVALSDLGINSNDLSAGVYFFLIIHDGKVIGKGKMAVI